MERRSIAPRRLHTYTRTYTHIHIYIHACLLQTLSIPTARVICLSFALSVHPCLYIIPSNVHYSARGVACVRVELLGSCFVGQARGAKERQRENQGPRATDQQRPTFPLLPSATVAQFRMALSHPLFLRSRARVCPLIEQYRQNRHEEGGTDRDNVQRDGTERERVSRKGLFTPLEMWNSCWPRIRRIKSL